MSNKTFYSTVDTKPVSSINPFDSYVSPPRQTMLGGNLTQYNIIDGATRKRIRSGVEREHAKGTFKHMFDSNVTIVAVIPRFPEYALKNRFAKNPMDLVIYENYETKELGCIEVTKHHCAHQHFGFNYQFNEGVISKLEPGARFKKGTVIADSPNVTEDGDYMMGLETNVAFVTDPSVTEDGFAISESYAKRISAHGFETRTFTCGRSHYPVNINGNEEEYKCIPDLGDTVGKNGLLAAFRPFDEILNPIYTTRKSLMKAAYGMDVLLYGIAGARVVDIKVYHNENVEDRGLPGEFTEQLRYYHELEKEFYMKVIKTCLLKEYTEGGKKKYYFNEHAKLEPDLWRVLYEGINYCGDELYKKGWWPSSKRDLLKVNRSYRGQILDEWCVEVTFEYTTEIAEGPKITNLSGSKGVAVAVWPDDCMPVDKFGNKADVLMYGGSTMNRMATSQMHRQAISATGRDVIKRIRRTYGIGDFQEIDYEDIKRIVQEDSEEKALANFEYLLGYYEIVSTDADYERAKAMLNDGDRWLRHLCYVIEDGNEPYGIYTRIKPGTTVSMADAIEKIRNDERYMPEMSEVTYKWPGDKEYTTTVEPILIGSDYFLGLEKTATDWSAVSSSKVGHFGTTTRLTQADKYSKPGRETSTKTLGEDEVRNVSASIGAEAVAEMNDLSNNPTLHKEVCKNILTAEKPTNIPQIIDREKYPVGGHRPLAYFHHLNICSGKEFKRGDE